MRHEWILASCHVSARSTQKFSRLKELHDLLPPRQLPHGSTKELVPDQHIEEFMPDGKDVFTDVSVIHPVAESYIQKGTSELGAAKYREGTKDAEYAEACRAAGKAFIPVVFETYGAWGPGAQQLFKIMKVNMGNKLPKGTAHSWTTTTWSTYHVQRLAVQLQKGNADAIIRRSARDFRATAEQDGHLPATFQDE
jgi:hypothetical protein